MKWQLPLALYLGCKKIVTIGWDIGDLSSFENGTEDDTQRVFQEHFYGDEHEKIVYSKHPWGPRRDKISSKGNQGIYYWLKNKV